jgi:DNA-binding response OmpR family regulator
MGNAGTKSILVVEDEPKIGEVCYRVLTSEGFAVDIAVNGSLAQKFLTQKDYDLCVIDIRMPVMDGKELFQVIAKRYPRLAGGVIFSTGDVIDGDTQHFLELTGRPHLSKPFTPHELITIVREALKQSGKKNAEKLGQSFESASGR